VVEPRSLLHDLAGMASEVRIDSPRLAETVAGGPLTSETLTNWQELTDALLATTWQGAQSTAVDTDMRVDVAAHRAVCSALAEIARQRECAYAGRDVVATLSSLSVRIATDETEGRVQVCDFKAIGSRRFDSLILGGFTEAEIPLRAGESPGDNFEIDPLGAREGRHADDVRLEFYSLLTRARGRLYLVRQEADSEGRECRASALWEDVLDVYRLPGAEIVDEDGLPIPCERISRADIEDSAPALTVGARARRRLAPAISVGSPEREMLASAEGLSALSMRTVYSATEIETYLECPYRWFFERVIRPREIDATLGARELGTHTHRILAAFYRRLEMATGHERVSGGWLGQAFEVFDQVAAAENERAMTMLGLSEELAVARAVERARSVVGQDALLLPDFVPREVEMEFGGDATPFVFAGSRFRGRIDRVDTSTASAFVTDYKSSKEVPGIAAFERGARVQAVIYACATQEVLGLPVSGSVYRSLRSGRLRGFWRRDLLDEIPRGMCEADGLDAEEYSTLVARTEERVTEAIEGMRGGRIPRAPVVAGACKHCGLAAFCEGASR
jgi:ATP-dependent helicase/nuclease subunit B